MNRLRRRRAAHEVASREHAVVHRVAALLLEYPGADLRALLPQVRAACEELAEPFRTPLTRLTDHLAARPLGELEADYVATFDLRRRCSLYLTYYAYGDTRKRGVALVEVKQAYRAAGFEMADDELPDHLCAVLELASTAAPEHREAGIRLLLAHRAGLELLRLALTDTGSPYADALAAVSATLPPLEGDDRAAVARLAAEGPPEEGVGLEPYGPTADLPPHGAGPRRAHPGSAAGTSTVPLPTPTTRPDLTPSGALR